MKQKSRQGLSEQKIAFYQLLVHISCNQLFCEEAITRPGNIGALSKLLFRCIMECERLFSLTLDSDLWIYW
jgi:hypothetical protein